ncbi:N-acetylmuramoyl-L-alanine amidase family protein [Ruminococcus flavefaciens]|uniref:Putative cell wall binding repeat-containing protein n=1 Tax=Ruminococcus flavefaciens TaxID=1265 RepID=A0A1M7K505_RUMFL|nr:N-acetylmuramoyl-L-alanine amidase family protein [Ruminococcus flavefaciens]SHM59907.1 Putative cell wall binding repeat-containing protein [Ruminococcus flavefaciens]
MKKAKILNAILSLAIFSTPVLWNTSNDFLKKQSNHLIAYGAYDENVRGKWIQDENTGKWWYKHDDSSYTKNSWEKIDNYWYHFDIYGWMETGWHMISGNWYYFNPNGTMHTGWKEINSKWYYLNTNGSMQVGWKKIDGKWYFFNPSGMMHTGWKEINSKWYYLNSKGIMQTGWQTIQDKKYYFNADGSLHIGWLEYNGKMYYLFDNTGVMVTGCAPTRNNLEGWCNFDSDGVCIENDAGALLVDSDIELYSSYKTESVIGTIKKGEIVCSTQYVVDDATGLKWYRINYEGKLNGYIIDTSDIIQVELLKRNSDPRIAEINDTLKKKYG